MAGVPRDESSKRTFQSQANMWRRGITGGVACQGLVAQLDSKQRNW